MKSLDVLQSLDHLIHSRSILLHPFYVAWQRGELTRDQLSVYATVYYPHVESFPRYLESAIRHAGDPVVGTELQQNLTDEISHPKAHNELWLDFAGEFGLDRSAVASATPHAAARNIVNTFDRLTAGSSGGALAALYAYESQQPEVSRRKADGLRQYYGVESARSIAYFEVHAETDIRHREGERDALCRCLDAGSSPEIVLDSADQALTAYWGLLDGICEGAGLTSTCLN